MVLAPSARIESRWGAACAVVGIAQSTFYYHRHKHTKVVQQREQRHAALKPLILQAAAESGQNYGYRRIHAVKPILPPEAALQHPATLPPVPPFSLLVPNHRPGHEPRAAKYVAHPF